MEKQVGPGMRKIWRCMCNASQDECVDYVDMISGKYEQVSDVTMYYYEGVHKHVGPGMAGRDMLGMVRHDDVGQRWYIILGLTQLTHKIGT
jgi:hypothetical protein